MKNTATTRNTPPSVTVMAEAKRVYQTQLDLPLGDQPFDLWWAIDSHWDINIFLDDNDKLQASLYYCRNDNTEIGKSWKVE